MDVVDSGDHQTMGVVDGVVVLVVVLVVVVLVLVDEELVGGEVASADSKKSAGETFQTTAKSTKRSNLFCYSPEGQLSSLGQSQTLASLFQCSPAAQYCFLSSPSVQR